MLYPTPPTLQENIKHEKNENKPIFILVYWPFNVANVKRHYKLPIFCYGLNKDIDKLVMLPTISS